MAEPIGFVSIAHGLAQAESEAGIRVLHVGDPVFQDDTVRTGADGSLEIRFADDTVMAQGHDSVLVLDEYVYDPDTGMGELLFDMAQGTFRSVTGNIVDHNPTGFELKSPLATIGIRGTETAHSIPGFGAPGAEQHLILVFDGKPVEVVPVAEGGQIRLLGVSGEKVSVDRLGAGDVRLMTVAEYQYYQQLRSDNLGRENPRYDSPEQLGREHPGADEAVDPQHLPEAGPQRNAADGNAAEGPGEQSGEGGNGRETGQQAGEGGTPEEGRDPGREGPQEVAQDLGKEDGGNGAQAPGNGDAPLDRFDGDFSEIEGGSGLQSPGQQGAGQGNQGRQLGRLGLVPGKGGFTLQLPGGAGLGVSAGAAALLQALLSSGESSASSGNDNVTTDSDAGSGITIIGNEVDLGTTYNDANGYAGSGETILKFTPTGTGAVNYTFNHITGVVKIVMHTPEAGVTSVNVTTNAASNPNLVTAGKTLVVDASAFGAGVPLSFDGSSETDGYFEITGGAGDDTIIGSDHNTAGDVLRGEGGADTIYGKSGSDTIYGGDGDDHLYGDDGADGGTGSCDDTIYGGAGADTIKGDQGADTIEGGEGADSIDGGSGTDTVSYAGSSAGVTVTVNALTGNTGGDAAGDALMNVENLVGSDHGDTLTGDSGANEITGGAGDDTIEGKAGADTLHGGEGTDTLSYANSGSGVTVSLAANTASGGDAAGDVIDGFENLTGSGQGDTLTGDSGANVISGGMGADTIEGGAGADTLSGGDDADIFIYNTGDFAAGETVDGGSSGEDRLYIVTSTDFTAGGGASISGVEKIQIADGQTATFSNNDSTWWSGAYLFGQATGVSTLAVNGTDGADAVNLSGLSFSGSWSSEDVIRVSALGGDDTITGSAGKDYLDGGEGDDTFAPGKGADTIIGGAGTDTIDHSGASTGLTVTFDLTTDYSGQIDYSGTTQTFSGIEVFKGGSNGDTLYAGKGTLSYDGAGGTDKLSYSRSGGTVDIGHAVTVTRSAADAGQVSYTDGGSTVTQTFTGIEQIAGTGLDDVFNYGAFGAIDVDGAGGNDTLNYQTGGSTTELNSVRNMETVVISGANASLSLSDDVVASGKTMSVDASALTGTLNIDLSNETDGYYHILGSGHDDVFQMSSRMSTGMQVDGAGGNDQLKAVGLTAHSLDHVSNVETVTVLDGSSSTVTTVDALVGVGQTLTVDASALTGTNALHFDGSAETCGSFHITGGAGADTLIGGAGADVISGGDGDDTIAGHAGADTLDGGAGSNTLSYDGETGNYALDIDLDNATATDTYNSTDTISNFLNLIGSENNDVLRGTSGDNLLAGGLGEDQLYGEGGDDIFLFRSLGEAKDTIKDFGDVAGDNDTLRFESSQFTYTDSTWGSSHFKADALGSGYDGSNASIGNTDAAFVYDTTTHELWYDTNGDDAGGQQLVCTVEGTDASSLTYDDIDFTS